MLLELCLIFPVLLKEFFKIFTDCRRSRSTLSGIWNWDRHSAKFFERPQWVGAQLETTGWFLKNTLSNFRSERSNFIHISGCSYHSRAVLRGSGSASSVRNVQAKFVRAELRLVLHRLVRRQLVWGKLKGRKHRMQSYSNERSGRTSFNHRGS